MPGSSTFGGARRRSTTATRCRWLRESALELGVSMRSRREQCHILCSYAPPRRASTTRIRAEYILFLLGGQRNVPDPKSAAEFRLKPRAAGGDKLFDGRRVGIVAQASCRYSHIRTEDIVLASASCTYIYSDSGTLPEQHTITLPACRSLTSPLRCAVRPRSPSVHR